MSSNDFPNKSLKNPKPVWRPFKRFTRSQDGVAAIEFAILALPFFMLIFAIIETFIAFAGEQLLSNAVDDLSRDIRTGQIKASLVNENDFRTKMCNEIKILLKCEGASANKLYIDVRELNQYSDISTIAVPMKKSGDYMDIDPSGFKYAPGGPGTINLIRAFYRWEVTADLMRPFLSNISNGGGKPSEYLMMATAAVRNEKYSQ